MSAHQLLLANLARTAIVLTIVGLLMRRRVHMCWSFMAYLVAILLGNSLVSFWPDRFYTQSFYILKSSVYNILKLCVAAELTYRVFYAFPGALARARIVLAPMLALIAVAIISVPHGVDYKDIVTRYDPQIQTGVIWLLSATAVMAVWYNLPLNRLHRVILLGFTSYLITFATLTNIMRSFGFERFRSTVNLVDGYAYVALATWWAVTAWRSSEVVDVAPERGARLVPALEAR